MMRIGVVGLFPNASLHELRSPFIVVFASKVVFETSLLTFSFFFSILSKKSSSLESVSSSSDIFDLFVGGT